MKRFLFLLAFILLPACQSKPLDNIHLESINFISTEITEGVKLKVYNLNSVNSKLQKITITNSETIKVNSRINQDLLNENFKIELINNELHIKTDYTGAFRNLVLDIEIQAPINDLHVQGAFNVLYSDPKAQEIKVLLEGVGELDILNVNTNITDLKIEGAGSIRMSGQTQNLEVVLEGAGKINLYDLIAQEADLLIEGAEEIQTTVQNRLKAILNGIGDISYKGNPEVISEVNGLGGINQK